MKHYEEMSVKELLERYHVARSKHAEAVANEIQNELEARGVYFAVVD